MPAWPSRITVSRRASRRSVGQAHRLAGQAAHRQAHPSSALARQRGDAVALAVHDGQQFGAEVVVQVGGDALALLLVVTSLMRFLGLFGVVRSISALISRTRASIEQRRSVCSTAGAAARCTSRRTPKRAGSAAAPTGRGGVRAAASRAAPPVPVQHHRRGGRQRVAMGRTRGGGRAN